MNPKDAPASVLALSSAAPASAAALMRGGTLPAQDVSTDVFLEKYAKNGESTPQELFVRVAQALAAAEPEGRRKAVKAEFAGAMEAGFVPAGRIASAAGTDIKATLMNCFVQPVGDAIICDDTGKAGIYTALTQAAETMRRGGGVGYDFSHIRPRGAWVKGTSSHASGPVSYMRVFDRSCETVESAGSRRGAQMGVMRCDHPDIEEFIHAKDTGDLKNFNISIAVTNHFMQAVAEDREVELWHAAKPATSSLSNTGSPSAYQRSDGSWVYRHVRARDLWEQVMRSTYNHAEPGILFLTRANEENNLHYCEALEATNPCAEQWLPNYGCCDLGSIDLTRFVKNPFSKCSAFDYEAFKQVVKTGVRMLDNALDVTFWPLPEQRQEAMNKRRIGVGFLGLGDTLIMLGVRYDSEAGRGIAAEISEMMRDAAYEASVDLAIEKGAFPLFDAQKYLASGFTKRLPETLRQRIAAHGIRNSHLLSIAPTGTITLAFADNASNGIEPAFSWSYMRKKRMPDGSHREYEVADHAWRRYRAMGGDMAALPDYFVSALQMSAEDHMRMLQAVQPFVDSSISKTVNVPADYPFEEFSDLYMKAWRAGLKGLATYRPNSVLGSVLSEIPKAADEAASTSEAQARDIPSPAPAPATLMNDDPLLKRFERRPSGELGGATSKIELITSEGNRSLYVIVNFAEVDGVINGVPVRIERPIEFFMPAAQQTGDQQWIAFSMRALSTVGRGGGDIAKLLSGMRQTVWDRGPVRYGWVTKADGTRAPRFHDSEVAAIGFALQEMLQRRGFLDEAFNQVPSALMSERLAGLNGTQTTAGTASAAESPAGTTGAAKTSSDVAASGRGLHNGKKCAECGAHAMHKKDGCLQCESCGAVGSCG